MWGHKTFGVEMKLVFDHFQYQSVGCTQNIWCGDETSIKSLSVSKCGVHKTFGVEMKLVFDHFQCQSVGVHTKHLVWR